MSIKKMKMSSTTLFAYGTLGVSLSALICLRNFSSYTFPAWKILLETDFGNLLAALVAVSGYLLEHMSARKAQQLEAQMARVTAQSHKLLIPITTQFHSFFLGSTLQFVDQNMKFYTTTVQGGHGVINSGPLKKFLENPMMELPTELSNPSSVAHLIGEVMMTSLENAEKVRSKTANKNTIDVPLATGVSASLGLVPRVTTPTELPNFLHRTLEQCRRPQSDLWQAYEAYVRFELNPAVNRIAEIIDQNGHLMEPVSPERIQAIFHRTGNGYGETWKITPRMWFYSQWLAYARAWQAVVKKWDDGNYSTIRPAMAFPVGLLFFNIEAQTIVAGVEKKLVGMSQMHRHDPNRI